MSKMLEKVARAIFDVSAPYADDCCHSPDYDLCPCKQDALEQARAAIEAMREPTADMNAAMKGAFAPTGRELYQMAIDAALK